MPPTLDDAWARAEWAHDALAALTLALEDFRDDHPFAVTDEVDLPTLTRVIRAGRPNPPPPLVGLLFADLLGGLRAALDQAACACVEAGGVGSGRHMRADLVRRLASDATRHIVLVTATPHSGNEVAFRDLLTYLDPWFGTDRKSTRLNSSH